MALPFLTYPTAFINNLVPAEFAPPAMWLDDGQGERGHGRVDWGGFSLPAPGCVPGSACVFFLFDFTRGPNFPWFATLAQECEQVLGQAKKRLEDMARQKVIDDERKAP